MATTEHTGTLKYVDGNGDINVLYPEIKTDTALSAEGKAADAKAVGDVLNNKLGNADIVDHLESTDTDKALSANQGNVIKNMLGDQVTYSLSGTTLTITTK